MKCRTMESLKAEKWWLFPMYMGRRLARIRIGAIPPDVKPGWIVAAIMKEINLDYEVVNTNRTKAVNLLGLGVEIFVTIAEEDFGEVSNATISRDRSLNFVIEGSYFILA